ncbi:MAG: DUF4160 domain-containing protein [Gallionella sp.]|nr:MAG: DUF4160 domain-containing protein [Gallionella sp.]
MLHVRRYNSTTSPIIFHESGFRFPFFSREEPRMHVHVSHPDEEAKFWRQAPGFRPNKSRKLNVLLLLT